MGQPYSTGYAATYLSFQGGAPLFVGFGERGVDIEEHPDYEPVMTDVSGPRKVFDMMMVGNDAIVSIDFTYWNETTLALAQCYANPGVGVRGVESLLDRGTLMVHEQRTMTLYVAYPRSVLAAYAQLPAGYKFFACMLQSPLRLSPGVRPYKVRCVFYAIAAFDRSLGFRLYDHDMSGLPAID